MSNTNIIHEIPAKQKAVAFTFDDGPHPIYTPQILEIFKEVSGKATFYMIGKHMLEHPEIVNNVVEQSHEIGNHTYSHPFLTKLSKDDCKEEIKESDSIIKKLTGQRAATFRPPYFDFNEDTVSIVQDFSYKMIGAVNMDAVDWEQPGVNHIVTKSRNHIRNGSIFLFHDGLGDRSQTVEAVRILVKELVDEGYQLVTVSELMQFTENKSY
ncbi:peptidoglycan/xylan/chitin deacetylase (PgdA/CDA1 family) [Evansella vedderi]|uniref:Peptidoglycan/xylan/chitin deacetylase (PgdA/CDA1 family) n=1 Tax=Evansella vedderi TaxID=38282 RepID=A0ABT9ZR33_9BACI|nr:polysaccharide deacetylase family protein [Evansella vedderi]MDQ0253329.1 peptidoglycan/xylan/chitin deacetylase (PgdA/CDA1 family) [Evansella vedderi]